MEQAELYDAIFKRKSVRKFDAEPLDTETMAKISGFLGTVKPMFPEIKTELKLLSGADVKAGLLKTKVPHFVAAFSEKNEISLVNVGFMLQQVDLFLSANGIGSLWQGNPKPADPERFSNLDFVIMLGFGRAMEPVHRESLSEFKRETMDKVSTARGFEDLIEPARLAPSAMNIQPWFFTGGEGMIHVYCGKSAMFDKWNQVGIGVAVCHAWVAAAHSGKGLEFVFDEKAKQETPKKYVYVVTLKVGGRAALMNASEPDVSYSFEVQVDNSVARAP